MLIILDYGVGNVNSVFNMLKKIGYNPIITNSEKDIEKASKIIISGVGSFDTGINNLEKLGIINLLKHKILVDKIPVLGICLGMQLMSEGSEEGKKSGLGLISGNFVKFNFTSNVLKIPHMSWNFVNKLKSSKLFDDMYNEPRFYFVHSYHFNTNEKSIILTETDYGYSFASSYEKENILGVQFHPEKSHKFGKKLLKNFVENY